MTRSEEIFRTMTVPQALKAMAVPAIAGQLIVLIYNLADTYYIGQTNDPAMVASVSLILPVFNLCLALGSLFGAGGGALLPKLLAKDEPEEASRTAAYCLRLGMAAAIGFSLLRWACLNIPLLFVFRQLFGMYGLVWSQAVSDALTATLSFLLLGRDLHTWN